ncbi:hypothetical protein [Streptomyces sp. 2131.1]|uniref:hypothetical protein n=1 Tax=Streptomyces sp. 2131.1 TaxID=1855346 RepID=UPI00210CF131|nr:hypothetical protein [Streptomyces sp. 2131.1]
MTFAAGERGQVRVHADYTFVDPVARADGDGGVTRTIVRRDLTTSLMDPARNPYDRHRSLCEDKYSGCWTLTRT